MIQDLLENWKIESVKDITPTSGGDRTWFIETEVGKYVLKKNNLENSKREYEYLAALFKTKVPIAVPIKTIQGDWYVKENNAKAFCLYRRLPGYVIDEHYRGDAAQRAQGFGRAIGLLHTCLQEINCEINHREMDIVGQIQQKAIPVISQRGEIIDTRAVLKIWEDVKPRLVSLCEQEVPQLIHRDAHPSNMLFSAGELTGFLDFEMVTKGLRIFDICYCGSSILIAGFETPEKERLWPTIFKNLVNGYQDYCLLTPLECRSFFAVLVGIELIFMFYWLNQEKVEEALQLERLLYWLKTNRDILLLNPPVYR